VKGTKGIPIKRKHFMTVQEIYAFSIPYRKYKAPLAINDQRKGRIMTPQISKKTIFPEDIF
jgi:hypothetical protein